eukprot:TRINITY_DN40063_c0_g1_i1.p1 TRINITY_DN40063_c0_g1~~TRINITY_DN40063_c0_g1_i1.p1  ORF type:complete len:109 (+),score=7.10 TRINITY_DN40063_c0_g1_i1:154-480(+)
MLKPTMVMGKLSELFDIWLVTENVHSNRCSGGEDLDLESWGALLNKLADNSVEHPGIQRCAVLVRTFELTLNQVPRLLLERCEFVHDSCDTRSVCCCLLYTSPSPRDS